MSKSQLFSLKREPVLLFGPMQSSYKLSGCNKTKYVQVSIVSRAHGAVYSVRCRYDSMTRCGPSSQLCKAPISTQSCCAVAGHGPFILLSSGAGHKLRNLLLLFYSPHPESEANEVLYLHAAVAIHLYLLVYLPTMSNCRAKSLRYCQKECMLAHSVVVSSKSF